MRRYPTDDSLEDFLKHNSERFQMRPSDKVWKGIQDNLKRRRRRIGWFTSLFLVCTSAGAYFLAQQNEADTHNTTIATTTNGTNAGKPEPGFNSRFRETPDITVAPATAGSRNEHSATTAAQRRFEVAGTVPATSGAQARVISMGSRFGISARSITAGKPELNPVATTTAITDKDGLSELSTDETRLADASLEEPVLTARPNLLAVAATPVNNDATAAKTDLKNRMSVQFFFTPTVSYRSLSENKDFPGTTAQGSPGPGLYNVNDLVTHKPNIGLELGLTAKYPVSRMVKVQGGLQFNMSRYDVQAFDNAQPQLAQIAFRGGGGQASQTNYSNIEGSSAQKDWLQNTYFQVSAPIGLELQLAGNEQTQFGIATTIQPTYILSDRVYMLSTDYKNYAEVPWLVRRWNINTALSTFVGYSTGKLNWQIGPQVRYQMLSSFVGKYPVKENLFDFGLRIGVSLNPGGH
jgi:hypothetical protein